ncbi:MAG: ABC transporter ATP-binding protein [Clostridiales bacterium]|nr:ABC transporter ATP-binding protein [Clostridiales bacterium]
MLSLSHVDVYYDQVQALFDITLSIGEREIVSVIGSNGAGKSTTMRSIMGLRPAKSGEINFLGKDITKFKTHQVVSEGIVYVPEGRLVFPDLSVQVNLEMGAFSKSYSKARMNEMMEKQFDLFPRLKERRGQLAGSLSGGEQQMLAIARGLMADPKLVMFDEPSLGLAPVIVDDMFDVIVRINREQQVPVLIVEQNAFMALSISHRAYVLENGVIKASGPSGELIESDEIRKAYLGG